MNITAGIYKGRKIIAPNEHITRPTLSKTRMGIFNTLYSIMGDFAEKSFLDVFGGSGIMGLEALSRGFEKVKVFELNKKSADIINKNYKTLGLTPDLLIGDSVKLLSKSNERFDIIYIDPPYESNLYEKILPLCNGEIIVVESSSLMDFDRYNIIKQKSYGSSYITYLENKE